MLAWGYFLYQGVSDPLGGINSLWPLFGIANQLLAAVALCVATTILIKMHRARYMWITCAAAGLAGDGDLHGGLAEDLLAAPGIGFLAQARATGADARRGRGGGAKIAETQALIFNARLDAVVCGIFLVLVTTILVDSIRVWVGILRGTRERQGAEAPFVLSTLKAEEI